MHIFRKWRRPRQKPPFGSQIDWSDTITDGLIICLLLNEFTGKLVGWTCYGNVAWDGIGLKFDGATRHSLDDITPIRNIRYGSVTISSLKVDSSANYTNWSFTSGNSWNTNVLYYLTDNNLKVNTKINNAHVQSFYTNSGDIAPNILHNITYRVRADGNNLFVNGKKRNDVTYDAGSAASNYFWGVIPNLSDFNLGWNYVPNVSEYSYPLKGSIKHLYIHSRPLTDDEIKRLHEEPYSFFLAPQPWFMIDLVSGQSFAYEGNIPVSLIPSAVKEVRFYRQGEVQVVITPQAEKQASYRAEGSQQITISPSGDKKASYHRVGNIPVSFTLAAEKAARYFAIGQVPVAVQVAGEKKALYRQSGSTPLSLIPDGQVRADYTYAGEVPIALSVQADIACRFNVEGGIGLVLLPQGSWVYQPADGGIVYTYEGNIQLAFVPQAQVQASFNEIGDIFLNISPAGEVAAHYRPISELIMQLIPSVAKTCAFTIEGEIQLHLVPQGVAVVVRPSDSEELFVIGVIEEDDIRAVFDGALHGDIWQ